jgi:hypothetical protein
MTEVTAPISVTWDGDKASFAKAFVTAQKGMESVKKASSNPAFKSKYADLSEVVEAVVPALNAAGIGVMQFPAFDGETVSITTVFLHESGASVTGTLGLRPSKFDPQGVGSATTYGRRYSLLAMTGTAPEDDDGNAASGPRQEYRRDEPPRREEPRRPAALVAAEAAIIMLDSVEACDKWQADNKAMLNAIDDNDVFNAIAKAWKARRASLAPAKVESRATSDFRAEELEGAL